MLQEAQMSQKSRAMLRVVENFAQFQLSTSNDGVP